jgi:hypothetical protein
MQSTENKERRTLAPEEIEAARELFLEYGEANAGLIVRKMRERGWKEFSRGELCGRGRKGKHEAITGLIEEQGWEEAVVGCQ